MKHTSIEHDPLQKLTAQEKVSAPKPSAGRTAPHERLAQLLREIDPRKGINAGQVAPLLAIIAEELDAEAIGFAERQGDGLILKDIVLDARHRAHRATLEAELRLVAAEAAGRIGIYCGPSAGLPGKTALGCALPGGIGAIVLLRENRRRMPVETAISTLELTSLALGSSRTASLRLFNQMDEAANHLCVASPTQAQEQADLLVKVFKARSAVITASNGRVLAISPKVPLTREAPAEKAMRELALRAGLATIPVVETAHEGVTSGLPALLNARFAVAFSLPGQGIDGQSIALLIDPDEHWQDLDPSGWKILQAVVDGRARSLRNRKRAFGRNWRTKGISILVLAAAAVALLVPLPDRIRAEAQLEADGRRFVTAAFDAVLKEAVVEPGDHVAEGDVVAVLEGENLELGREAAAARAQDADHRRDEALRQKKITEAELARISGDAARSELNLLDWQIRHLELRAPVDGIVLASPLEQSGGAPVREGDLILEIAPLDRLRVRVDVPVRDLNRLPSNLQGELHLDGGTGEPIPLSDLQKAVKAMSRNGKTVLPLRTTVENTGDLLHPGQKGVVVLSTGWSPLGEILFRDAWLTLRQWSL